MVATIIPKSVNIVPDKIVPTATQHKFLAPTDTAMIKATPIETVPKETIFESTYSLTLMGETARAQGTR